MRRTTPTTVHGEAARSEELSIGVVEVPAFIADIEMEAEAGWLDEFDGVARVFGLEEDPWVGEPEPQYVDQIAELYALAEEFGECLSHTESDVVDE